MGTEQIRLAQHVPHAAKIFREMASKNYNLKLQSYKNSFKFLRESVICKNLYTSMRIFGACVSRVNGILTQRIYSEG